MTRNRIQFVSVMALLLVLAGCSSNGPILRSMPDRMDGLFLDIKVEKPGNSIAVYSITQDGTLAFAGGVEAKRGETDWSTELTPEQRQRINDMVNEFGWLRNGPTSVSENREHAYEISVRRRASRMSCEITGDHAQVVEMVKYLDDICMARFDEYLDRLPRASQPAR